MLVGRCSWELSGRKLYRKIKKSQTPGKPRDLQFRGPLLETRNTMLKQNCHLACPGVPWDRGSAVERSAVFFQFSPRR
jgi:hypothetical protein